MQASPTTGGTSTSGDSATLCGHTWLCRTDRVPCVPCECPCAAERTRAVSIHGRLRRLVPRGCHCKSARQAHHLSPGRDTQATEEAQLGKGCQQAVAGQWHTMAGGAGLALVPEQMGLSRQQEMWVCVPTAYIP